MERDLSDCFSRISVSQRVTTFRSRDLVIETLSLRLTLPAD